MRVVRNLAIYVTLVGLFVAGILVLLHLGSHDAALRATAVPGVVPGPAAPAEGAGALERLGKNLQEPLALLLLQIVVIVAAARGVGALFARFGQPPVIGEMLAGILLGPSFFGLLAPHTQAALFPASSMGALRMLSQIGVIVFMFVVGIDLDVAHLRQRSHAAVLVSHASIVVPFFLGTGFALFVYRDLAPPGVPFNAFALFLGIAMSITAFPVLARILEERGLAGTSLGATAIACAAVDDVTAWCLLALVVAIVKASALTGALATMALTLAFIAAMLLLVKPLVARLIRPHAADETRAKALLAGVLTFLFLSALATETIGIHALFGAFLAGVAMPAYPSVRDFLKNRLESFSAVVLLPLFFAFTGLRTQVGLLADSTGWLLCLALIAVAIVGKLGGSMLAARVAGMGWGESFALGALMNTRGLVELIVLNLGYDLGILSPRIFAMMVLMALTTTFATGPLLALHERWRRRHAPETATGAAA
jgi:Kef-type K+ transport system membrane component KefB